MDKINLKGKNILVTGGNGYLGKHLIYELLKRCAVIFCIDISKGTTLEVIKYYQVDLRDLALQLKMILNSKSKINFGAVPYRENEVWEMVGDNTKSKELLKFKQKYLLIQGLKSCYNI